MSIYSYSEEKFLTWAHNDDSAIINMRFLMWIMYTYYANYNELLFYYDVG